MAKDIRQIGFADSNTYGILNPLISFNCLIDTDFGLLVLIAQKFFDTDVFDEEFFRNNNSVENMKYSIYEREERNPLTLCLKNKEYADDYYNQFFEKYYQGILIRSMNTDLAKSLKSISNSGAVFTILCNNEMEVNFIRNSKTLNRYSTILSSNTEQLSSHEQYFFKDYQDIPNNLFNEKMRDKSFYIGRYKFTEAERFGEKDAEVFTFIDMMRCVIFKFDLYQRKG